MRRNKVVFEMTKRIFRQGTSWSVSQLRKKGSYGTSNKLKKNNCVTLGWYYLGISRA